MSDDAPIANEPAPEPDALDIDSINPDELGVSDADLPAGDGADETTTVEDDGPDPFDDEEVTQFSRGYVQKLRKEAEQARIQARELEDNLGQFLPSIQQALGDYLGNTEHKEAAATWLSQVMGDEFVASLDGGAAPAASSGSAETDDDDDIITAADARKLAAAEFDRRQEEAAQRAEEKRVAEYLGQHGLGPDAEGNPHPHTWDILNRMRKGATLEDAVSSYEKGVREYELEIERRAIRKLLDRKKADADANPKVAAAEGGTPEPGGFDLSTAAGRRAAAAAVAASKRSRPAS